MRTKLLIGIILIFTIGVISLFFQTIQTSKTNEELFRRQYPTPETVITKPTEKPDETVITIPIERIPQKVSCPEKRSGEGGACIALYKPVCAEVQVQCFRAPCPPIQQTFGNSCEACNNPLIKDYTEGECEKK